MRVLITQLCNVSNKGDQAILKSQIQILREMFADLEISVLTLWSERLLRQVEPSIEVYSPVIDLKVIGKEPPLVFSPLFVVSQVFLSMISLMLLRFNLKLSYRFETLNLYRSADLVISSGHEPFMEGSLYQERYNLLPKIANLFVLFWGAIDVFIAKKVFKKPFMTFPQSVGPFKTLLGRLLAKFIFSNCDAILLRESVSLRFLKNLKINTPVFVVGDMAFLFKSSFPIKHQLQRPSIGVSPCFAPSMSKCEQRSYVMAISETLDYLIMRYGVNVIFLPSQIGQGKAATEQKIPDDLEVCQKILEKMTNKKQACIFDSLIVEEFEQALSQLDLLITTRMHPSILASTNFVPFVSINYEHKQIGLLTRLHLDDVGLNVNEMSYETLKSKVEYVWFEKERIKERLLSSIPILQEQIRTCTKKIISEVLAK